MYKVFQQSAKGRLFTALASILVLLVLSGCPKPPISPTGPVTQPSTQASPTVSVSDVIMAYNAGKMRRAYELSNHILQNQTLTSRQQADLLRVKALSSSRLDAGSQTLADLELWRRAELAASGKPVDASNEWTAAWRTSLSRVSDADMETEVQRVINDASRPWQLRVEARMVMPEKQLRTAGATAFATGLENAYLQADISTDRAQMEKYLFRFLHRLDRLTLSSLAQLVDDYNEKRYPYALFQLEHARRLNMAQGTRAQGLEIYEYLRQDSELSDRNIFRTWMDPDSTALSGMQVISTDIALVLPLRGQFGNFATNIVSGAQIACRLIEMQGYSVRLYIIDMDQPGWIQDIMNLPQSVQIVGGPLLLNDYLKIKEAGLTDQRLFFGFLSRLPDNDEGTRAWRFFSSDADQARAVIRFARHIGIANFGSLIPNEPYGSRMNAAFTQELENQGGNLVKSGTYPVRLYKDWSSTVAGFLGTSKSSERAPATYYRALYLPDSWNEVSMLVPYFHYYHETRLLLLGSSLWGESIAADSAIDYNMFRNAIYPGAWDANSTDSGAQTVRAAVASGGQTEANFWHTLGYDFINLATTLNIPPNATHEQVNQALTQVNTSRWSAAPIRWDARGKAYQDLHVFSISPDGIQLADPEKFRTRINSLWNN